MKRKKIYNPESQEKTSDQKRNFFEGNVTNYSKGSLDLDDFRRKL